MSARASGRRRLRGCRHGLAAAAAAGLLASGPVLALPAAGVADPRVVGDAIPEPLQGLQGDPVRGRALVTDRRAGLCLLCHQGPFPEERTPGNLSTDLTGTGSRWTAGQLRLRVVDARRLNPGSLMPAFHRTEGLHRVGAAWQGRPILDAQQVEDVVAFLVTLR
jgi:sulfur-oxidizing protein SoxX